MGPMRSLPLCVLVLAVWGCSPGESRTDGGTDAQEAGDTGGVTVDAPVSDVGPDAACPVGQMQCGSGCIDVRTDNANCGACRNLCRTGSGCVDGSCSCMGPRLVCNNQCIDVNTDAMNCGRCGNACPAGQSCGFGMCVDRCDAPRMLCNNMTTVVCADLQSDPNNCGICNARCSAGYQCMAGRCRCPAPPRTMCATACADLQTDPAHCGMCDVSCGMGRCTAGSCVCAASETRCGMQCFDTRTNASHCGGCDRPCRFDQSCVAGVCACGPTRTSCGGFCVDAMTDAANCGGCGNSCGVGGACAAGRCTCAAGWTLCGARCAEIPIDNMNCGSCGMVCGANTSCIAGVCVPEPAFRITSLGTTGCTTVAMETVTTPRGGLSLSRSNAFYVGAMLARFAVADLSGGVTSGMPHDGMFADIESGTIYTILDTAGVEPRYPLTIPFIATQLGVIDGMTGALTSTRIRLTTPITFERFSVGFYSGSGRALFNTGYTTTTTAMVWYHVRLPSGVVTMLRTEPYYTRLTCPSWAHFGIAEYFGGQHYAVYAESTLRVVRRRIMDGTVTALGTFTSLGAMCSMTFAPGTNRWYFHTRSLNQFRPTATAVTQTLGFCSATFDRP